MNIPLGVQPAANNALHRGCGVTYGAIKPATRRTEWFSAFMYGHYVLVWCPPLNRTETKAKLSGSTATKNSLINWVESSRYCVDNTGACVCVCCSTLSRPKNNNQKTSATVIPKMACLLLFVCPVCPFAIFFIAAFIAAVDFGSVGEGGEWRPLWYFFDVLLSVQKRWPHSQHTQPKWLPSIYHILCWRRTEGDHRPRSSWTGAAALETCCACMCPVYLCLMLSDAILLAIGTKYPSPSWKSHLERSRSGVQRQQ